MSLAPAYVAVKRKAGDHALDALILEQSQSKKQKRQPVEYRLKAASADEQELANAKILSGLKSTTPSIPPPPLEEKESSIPSTTTAIAPRRFQLQRKRGADTAGFATFIEKRQRALGASNKVVSRPESRNDSEEGSENTPLKRPGANAQELKWRADTWKSNNEPMASPSFPEQPEKEDPALADTLHQFALEEIEHEEVQKPKLKYQPKRPIRRLRNRDASKAVPPQPQVHVQDEDVDMDMSDSEDYVVDIYVRTEGKVSDDDSKASGSIGYLVITEKDESIWETYLEDDEEDKEVDSDDEDENAEDYYGADYPEDEVASDDEMGQGAYGYRHGGSDDEEWDSDTGAFSDEEDTMRNPWKTYPWSKGPKKVPGSDDENDEQV